MLEEGGQFCRTVMSRVMDFSLFRGTQESRGESSLELEGWRHLWSIPFRQ